MKRKKGRLFYDQIYDRCVARAIADFRRERIKLIFAIAIAVRVCDLADARLKK